MGNHPGHPAIRSPLSLGALAFFVTTLALGLLMRWDLAIGTFESYGLGFANLRHAHSHAGYYGVLTLGWWLVAERGGAAISVRWQWLYVVSAFIATTAFAFLGYQPFTIALSTLIAGLWLFAGATQWRRRSRAAWLDTAPFGLAFSVALVPVIAIMAKRDFTFSRDLAHVFIASVLFTVFVPAAWQASGVARRVSLEVYVPFALGAAARLVLGDQTGVIGAAAAIGFALVVAWVIVTEPLSAAEWLLWLSLPTAVVLGSVVPAFRGYNWRIGGLHFLILGPVMFGLFGTKAGAVLRTTYVTSLLAMVTAIIAPQRFIPDNPALATAIASSVFVLIALYAAAAAWLRRASRDPVKIDTLVH